jgi:TetR/AcrR family transcriptional regulator
METSLARGIDREFTIFLREGRLLRQRQDIQHRFRWTAEFRSRRSADDRLFNINEFISIIVDAVNLSVFTRYGGTLAKLNTENGRRKTSLAQVSSGVRQGKAPARKQPVAGVRTPGRPKAVPHADDAASRRMILEAALQSFSQFGFDGSSITSIARLHRVSPPLIHYYFKSKDELWRAAMDQGIGDMVRNIQAICAEMIESDSIARLKFFIRRYVAIVAEKPAVFRVIIRESDMPGPRLTWLAQNYMTPLYTLVTGLVERAQSGGKLKSIVPPYHMAQIITGACYHFLSSRNRLLATYGVDVNIREIRELHANAVIDILFTGMLV